MKKPIDPNLNNNSRDELFGFAPVAEPVKESVADESPDFRVVDKDKARRGASSSEKKTEVSASSGDSGASSHHHHHHHHSSSGSSHSGSSHHQHSSSGSSHRSSKSSKRHHHSSKKKKLPLPAKIAIGIIIVILLAIIVVIAGFFILRHMGKNDVLPKTEGNTTYHETVEYKGHTYKFNSDVVSIGFLGVDQRTLETVDNTDFVGAADADIIVTVDTKTGKSKVIALPRDTMVDIEVYSPESGVLIRTEKAQLCLAYAYGDGAVKSCESTIDAMSRILYNVPIHKYFALDLDGIAPLNDAIGGVKLTSLFDFPDEGIKTGDTVTLKGEMAEKYVRLRSLDSLDASLKRTDRQIQYVKAYASRLLPSVINNFAVVNNLYNTASSYSRTNLTLSNATYLASLLLQKGINDFETYTIKGEMKASQDPLMPNVVHAEFYPDEESVMETVLDVFYTQVD